MLKLGGQALLKLSRKNSGSQANNQGESGFTLIEVSIVIVLLVLLSTLAVSKLGALDILRVNSAIRQFTNTWEFLAGEALSRGKTYRLVIDLRNNAFLVRRELPLPDAAKNADRIATQRLDSERQRLEEKQLEEELSLEEEFAAEDERQLAPLEELYFEQIFSDPDTGVRLAIPLDFPSLGKRQNLPPAIRIRDVELIGKVQTEGLVNLRLSPSGAVDSAIVHFVSGESSGAQVFSALINPATLKVELYSGERHLSRAE